MKWLRVSTTTKARSARSASVHRSMQLPSFASRPIFIPPKWERLRERSSTSLHVEEPINCMVLSLSIFAMTRSMVATTLQPLDDDPSFARISLAEVLADRSSGTEHFSSPITKAFASSRAQRQSTPFPQRLKLPILEIFLMSAAQLSLPPPSVRLD